MQWKVFVNTADAGNKMIFEGSDRAFRGVSSMETGRNELKINFFGT